MKTQNCECLGSVFELSENDELNDTYYTRGFFATLADAVAEVEKHGIDLCEVANDSRESACIEIHEHPFGLCLRGRPKWERRWVYDYEREHGDRWQISETGTTRTLGLATGWAPMPFNF